MCSPRVMDSAQASKSPKRKKPPTKATVEPMPEAVSGDGDSKFARALGSSDGLTRERGLQALARWLSSRQHVSELDMRKIWKGLFYAFWHSDKAPVQGALADRLSAVLVQLSPDVAHTYFVVFFRALREEWFGIDRLRLDKFMLLIRRMLRQLFRRLHDAAWPADEVARYCDFMTASVLVPTDSVPALGVTYHVIDCWLPELLEASLAVPAKALHQLLEPVAECAARTPHPACLSRLREGVIERLIADTAAGELDPQQLDVDAFAKQLFDLGALVSTRARNREVLYSVSKGLLMARRKRQRVSHPPGIAAAPFPVLQAAAASSGDAPEPSAVNSAPETAEAQQTSHAERKAAEAAEAADGAAPQVPAEADVKMSGSKAKRKRAKKVQQQLAEANGDASAEPGQEADAGDNGTAPDASGLHSMRGVHQEAETPVPAQSAAQRAQQSRAETNGSNGIASGRSSGASAGPGQQPSLRRVASVSAADTPGEQTVSPRASSKRKSVRFHLRDNLFFEPGGQVPPPAVRTPPKAQPKGSALKVKLTAEHTSGREKSRLRSRSPNSMPRAVAASFF